MRSFPDTAGSHSTVETSAGRRLRGLAKRFADDRSGNFAILTGISLITVMMGVGLAVDTAQSYHVKSSLQSALDAAVTSTAFDITTGKTRPEDAQASVEKFLNTNGRATFTTQGEYTLMPVVVDRTARTIEATAFANVALAFPVFGVTDPRVSISSAALYSDKQIEVAMMLDVTGSMAKTRTSDKIGDLKTAAANAVDSFLDGQDPTKPRVRVAIVPYANSVNAGALAASTVYVERSAADRKQAPGSEDPIFVSGASRPDNCATERKGAYQYTDDPVSRSLVNRDFFLSQFAANTDTAACPAAAVTPLTADAVALKKTIGKLAAQGGTGGHIGIQWTWYMLSQKWGSVMSASQRPGIANPKKVAKYAILMTDGEFNLSFFDANSVDKVYDGNGKAATRTAAKTLCTAMKAQGIEVFSIGFQLENDFAKDTMKACSSADKGSVKHYFQTSTGEELDAAFQEIARNIERLAITR